MGRQTLSRDNYLSLPSLVRRRVSGVPPWRNGQSAGHMIGRLGATRATSVLLPRSINKY